MMSTQGYFCFTIHYMLLLHCAPTYAGNEILYSSPSVYQLPQIFRKPFICRISLNTTRIYYGNVSLFYHLYYIPISVSIPQWFTYPLIHLTSQRLNVKFVCNFFLLIKSSIASAADLFPAELHTTFSVMGIVTPTSAGYMLILWCKLLLPP